LLRVLFCPQEHGSEEITIVNPAQFPERSVVSEYLEPMVVGTILTPDTFTGQIMSLCLVHCDTEHVTIPL
jgi:translation elongation factor EF-4